MNSSETKSLWISLGAALLAVFLLYSWSQEQKAELHRKFGSSEQVVVALKDIKEMQPILEQDLDVVDRPVDFVEPAAIQNPEEAIGQLAAAPIKAGEQILNTKLLPPGKLTGLSMEVSPGKRALTLPIDAIRGVSKLIKPGDRIDIVAAIDVGSGNQKHREVRTLLQDVVVLATGQRIANQVPVIAEEQDNGDISIKNLRLETGYTNITIEAKPGEVQKLVYILSTSPGGLFLSLRNTNDRIINPLRVTKLGDVLGRVSLRKPAAFVPKPPPLPKASVRPKTPLKKKRPRGPFVEVN